MDLNETICFCTGVTGNDIKDAVEKGAKTYEEIQEATGAGTVCGACEDQVKELIEQLLNK